ncbi:MAG: response regulator transcription factor [Aggregatilineales bacterium]
MTIRILVADDHPVVRDGLVMILNTQSDFEVIAQADNGADAVRQAQSLQPDVILLDLEMPGMDGLDALKQLRDLAPNIPVLVFTAFDTDERIVGAVQAGAKGYLLKGAPRNDLFNALRVVSEGGALLQPIVASKLMNHMRHQNDQPAETLTEREDEVLHLLAEGKTNKEIAAALVITERTVKFHISSILGKLGAGNRTEAVRIAAQMGLVDLGA